MSNSAQELKQKFQHLGIQNDVKAAYRIIMESAEASKEALEKLRCAMDVLDLYIQDDFEKEVPDPHLFDDISLEDEKDEEEFQDVEEESEEESEQSEPTPKPRPLPTIRKCPNSYSSAVPTKEVPKVNRKLPFTCLLIKIGKDKYNHKFYSKFRISWDKLLSTLKTLEESNPKFDFSEIRSLLTSSTDSRKELLSQLEECLHCWREDHPKNGSNDKRLRRQFKQNLLTLISIVNECVEAYDD